MKKHSCTPLTLSHTYTYKLTDTVTDTITHTHLLAHEHNALHLEMAGS